MVGISARRTGILWTLSAIAIIFGMLTVKAGGQVLFGGDAFREAAGRYIPFVLWFNFLAGFVYVVAGVGIWLGRQWAVWLSLGILLTTTLTFTAFGLYASTGGEFEVRTVAAMTLRCIVWATISLLAYRALIPGRPTS